MGHVHVWRISTGSYEGCFKVSKSPVIQVHSLVCGTFFTPVCQALAPVLDNVHCVAGK